jgi:probable RNA-binding protein EIF1AD
MSSQKAAQKRAIQQQPTLENDNQMIVRVHFVRGGNMVDVVLPDGSELLCDIPSRFTKKIWMKRGDYLIVENYEATKTPAAKKESKIKAVVIHVLTPTAIKQLVRDGVWPSQFDLLPKANKRVAATTSQSDLPGNPNRRPAMESDSEDGEDRDKARENHEYDDDDLPLPPNRNRMMPPDSSSDEE